MEDIMLEMLEKTILAGMGAVSLSQKKAEEFILELKQRFNVSEEEGKALLDKLQDAARENQKKLEELAREEVRKTCDRMGVVTSDEFEKLQKRVHKLEKQLKESGQ
jgi:polyhydroxyalkanoate synthesis regulator phasin